MNSPLIPLSSLPVGECATVAALFTEGSMRRRFLDLGLIAGTTVTCIGESPLGDPRAYAVYDTVIAIRSADCQSILVCPKAKEALL